MKSDQKAIYYLAAGYFIKSAKLCTILEELLKRDYEGVVLFVLSDVLGIITLYSCQGRKLLTLKERGCVYMGYMMVCRDP